MTSATPATTHQDTAKDILSGASVASPAKGFQRIADFVDNFNQSCEPGQRLDKDDIISKLKLAGAVNDDVLRTLTVSSLGEATGLSAIIATALIKQLQQVDSPVSARRITRLAAQTIAVPELFNRYDPNDVGSAVGGELLRLTNQYLGRNPRIIVFDEDGRVNGPLSYKLFEDALRGDPDIDQVTQGGKLYYTYRINERPHDVVSIHPITGENLRSNGVANDGLDWSPVSDAARFILRHAVATRELASSLSRRDMVYYHTAASAGDAIARLSAEFPQAARRYQEGVQIGQQPPIRRVRQGNGDPSQELRDGLTSRRNH